MLIPGHRPLIPEFARWKSGESEVLGHPGLHSKLWARLKCIATVITGNESQIWEERMIIIIQYIFLNLGPWLLFSYLSLDLCLLVLYQS